VATSSRVITKTARRGLEAAVIYFLLTCGALVAITPLFWAISTSLKVAGKEFSIPIDLIPRPVTFESYVELFSNPIINFDRIFLNSVIVSVPTSLGVIFISSLGGFSFAKLYFKGRDTIFVILLGTMMIPMAVTLIPRYILMKILGWLNTFWPLIIPTVMTSVYGTFLMRQFYNAVPNDLLDSARVEGCSPFYMYAMIAVPLAKPALMTLFLITFMASWNNLFIALVYLQRPIMFTLQLGLSYLNSEYDIEWRMLMAGTVVTTLPVILVFLALQRYYVQGITLSGMKG
jgi:multiple sugar transport system permease protein